jgi:fumarate hydratase class II
MSNSATRTESDTFGPIEVPSDRYWGAQTQRSLQNFAIGDERMPRPIVHALGLIKQAAAGVNSDLGLIEPRLAQAIAEAAAEVAEGKHDAEFPPKRRRTPTIMSILANPPTTLFRRRCISPRFGRLARG